MRTVASSVLPLFLFAPLGVPAAQDAPPPETGYADRTEVTAVDAVTELPGRGPLGWLVGGRGTEHDDLVAATGGMTLPVVAVEEPAPRLGRIVLYFDLSLSDDFQVEWAADLLAQRAADLVALGEVEIVVAGPEAVTALPPSRSLEAVEEALGRLASFVEPDDALVELRMGSGGDGRKAGPGHGPDARNRSLPEREARLIERSLDELLLALVDRSEAPDTSEDPRRAVFLVSGGFDLRPAASSPPEDLGSERRVRRAGRTLAAYGWRVIPLLAPDAAGPVPGLRLGKWRVTGGPLPGAVYEERRDPDLAEAHVELALALQREGRPEPAAEAAETAMYHFSGDTRTRKRQAEVLLLLAELYEELGDAQRARRKFRRAARYHPEALADHPWTAAMPRRPWTALATLAEAGGGIVSRGAHDLSEAVASLARRAVVTIQIPGSPDGTLQRIEIRDRTVGERPPVEAWIRFGTPPWVEEARSRR